MHHLSDIFKESALSDLTLNVCKSVTLCIIRHPFSYARFLMQIGGEPKLPIPTKDFTEALPIIFQYVNCIRKTDGFWGLYSGLTPQIAGDVISILSVKGVEYQFLNEVETHEISMRQTSEWLKFQKQCKREVIKTSVIIVVSHPFLVISNRMMAQYVGKEQMYNSIFTSIEEILKTDGLHGFYTGLIPRALREFISLFMYCSLIYIVNTHINENGTRAVGAAVLSMACDCITYPFNVITACITVNNCGLAGGLPPNMPKFDSWTHTWWYLQKTGQLQRGKTHFSKTATEGAAIAISKYSN